MGLQDETRTEKDVPEMSKKKEPIKNVRMLLLRAGGKYSERAELVLVDPADQEELGKIIGADCLGEMKVKSPYFYLHDEEFLINHNAAKPNQMACDTFVKLVGATKIKLSMLLPFSAGIAIRGNVLMFKSQMKDGKLTCEDLTDEDLKLISGPKDNSKEDVELSWGGFDIKGWTKEDEN